MLTCCASDPPPEPAAPTKRTPESVACPALSSRGRDLAGLFGIDPTMAARIDRTVKLASELEATAGSLENETNAACSLVARDLDPAPWTGSPCAVAATRLDALRAKIAATGGKLGAKVAAVRCELPENEIAQCAGECVTGAPNVVSRVSCRTPGADCSADFELPNAPPACLARCRTRALRTVQCSADVTLEIDGAPADPELRATLDRLQKDASRIVALGTEMAGRATDLARLVASLVDELGATVDAMTSSGDAKERRVAIGAVLATCLAPPLAQTVRASGRVGVSLDEAKQLHAVLVRL